MAVPNIAVLGLSHGWKFVDCLKKSSIANLVAVADLNPEKAIMSYNINNLSLSDCIGKDIEIFKDYKELLKKTQGRIDGIIAALPNDLHVEVTEEAAKMGLSLMLEKPIACNMEEANKIIKAVNDSKIKFMVAHHRRFSKKVLRIKEAIEKGELGRIVGVEMIWAAKKPDEYFEQKWRTTEGVGGPLLINTIHDVDILRYLVGEIDMVQAYMTNKSRGNQVEDAGAIIVGFKNGAVASIILSDNAPSPWFYEACSQEYTFFYPSNFNCYKFLGEKAAITFPNMDMYYYEKDSDAGWHRPIKQEKLTVERFDVIEEELKHFCEIINGEADSKVTAEDAAESLRVIEAIKESSRLGKAVYL
ncbi:MAG: Gfo/Idh/MocA family protein [Acetivibrionales bacterium]